MKKKLIFILYDLGISLSALSNLYRFEEIDVIERVIQGDYLELQFNKQIFSNKDLKLLGSKEKVSISTNKINLILEDFKRDGVEYFVYYETEYPELLKKIPYPPFFLFMKGNKELLKQSFICSIVGTRKPSRQTLKEIDLFVSEMVKEGIVTSSGLALGTDINVHLSTINKNGMTIAVLPGPINSILPKSHTQQALDIIGKNGLLISEYYLEDPHNKENYINRNRIISGISNAVVIAECEESSGTMHTARFAYVQKKSLYCFDNKSSGIVKILNSNSAKIFNGISSLK